MRGMCGSWLQPLGSDLVLPTAGLLGTRRRTEPGVKTDQGASSLHQQTYLPVWALMGNGGAFWTRGEVAGSHFFYGLSLMSSKKTSAGICQSSVSH